MSGKKYTEEERLAVVEAATKRASEQGVSTRSIREALARGLSTDIVDAQAGSVHVEDFYAYAPEARFIYVPTRETWPASSVDCRLPAINKGLSASKYISQTRSVEQMTWAPGEPMLIPDRLIAGGGWIPRPGANVFNLYRPPVIKAGNSGDIDPWVDHLARIYPEDVIHIINWLAHRVQRPGEKLNHALVLGGAMGIGKDTLVEPLKDAVGAWNFTEILPPALMGRFNGFVKSVVLRISEARDLGDVDRYAFHEHMKTYLASPPDVLRVDEKNMREYSVPNLLGVIITSNHKTNGIYLPADDRRHYVAWSDNVKEDFTEGYWNKLWGWFDRGGSANVAAYLRTLDLSGFDPKAPPAKTAAWREIVDSNRVPEDAELADALDLLGNPSAVTVALVAGRAVEGLRNMLLDRAKSRQIPHRFDQAGYVSVRNDAAKDGYFNVGGKRMPIYARRELSVAQRMRAAQALATGHRSVM